jgi:MoCo/4Fe-4S cofactor protein with predicted Tat translocation signal
MEFNNQEVWVGVSDLTNDPAFIEQAKQEFPTTVSESLQQENGGFTANRRDFLKYLGFGVGAATIAASCEIPIKRAIPYVQKPDTIVPGVANYYASSFVRGGHYVAVLVKQREGRPIKIEGNSLSEVTMGATSARAQAAVLDLYDINRLQSAVKIEGTATTKMLWADLDAKVKSALASGMPVRIIAHSISSPMMLAALADFTKKYPNTKVIQYDPMSVSALLDANATNFGIRAVPEYRFDKAKVIVSFNADFLGTWISPVEFAVQYAKNRKVDAKNPKMSRHIQVESHMSMTGSNADNRILVKPSEQGAAILAMYNAVVGGGGSATVNTKAGKAIAKVAQELLAAKGESLVVTSSTNQAEQQLVNAINQALGNYGSTISFANANMLFQGNDSAIQGALSEMSGAAVFILGANPVFELPNGDKFAAALKTAALSVSFNPTADETTLACQYAAPTHNWLESWGDVMPRIGHYSLVQPTITPLFETRQAEQSLLMWADACPQTAQPAYDYLRASWEANQFRKQTTYKTFQAFWDATLHDGVLKTNETGKASSATISGATLASGISVPNSKADQIEVSFFENISLGNGLHANNPWLQEMPDPVTRNVWGNTLALPIEFDGKNKFSSMNGLEDGDKVTMQVAGKSYDCVVVRQFGQMKGTVSIALGHGRTAAGTCSNYGTNVQGAVQMAGNSPRYYAEGVTISEKTGVDKEYASVQHHHTMGVTTNDANGQKFNADEAALAFQGSLVKRTVIRQSNLKEIKGFISHLQEEGAEIKKLNSQTLYRGHNDRYLSGLHWGMHVDLNACIGCGACTVACMSENNVPVVGKFEVNRHHEMTWLRIDRYYYGDVENPNVVYQPLMCQHCDNAPCENVCPVNATNHSSEGLNQMTYNRCIGTRYCANNCPYKVRRFNWQDYTTADIFPMNERKLTGATLGFSSEMPYGADNLTRMVLNPDVTVRTRGVIEKCSFCVQRIQEGKLTAKRETRALTDGDVKTACQTACPTGAIIFGNKNDKESLVSKARKSPLNYRLLEEVNVDSNVTYSAKIINRDEKLDA